MGRFLLLCVPLLVWVIIVFVLIGLGAVVAWVLTLAVNDITFPQALLIGVIATVAATHWIVTVFGAITSAVSGENDEYEEDEFDDEED